ncbi:MAG: FkbM family methyltransferase [Planctomycetota bacterium]
MSMLAGLRRAAGHGLDVRSIIDIGASDGRWTALARECWPSARRLLIEAQTVHEPALRALASATPGTEYALVTAGPQDGEVWFDTGGGPFGGVAATVLTEESAMAGSGANRARWVRTPMRSIDSLVAERGLPPPFLVKLDTHGFEAPILAGATDTLRRTELLVIEAYNFRLTPECLRFHELIAHLEKRGFRCLDMCDVSRRTDGVLWQMDLFFARGGRSPFAGAMP